MAQHGTLHKGRRKDSSTMSSSDKQQLATEFDKHIIGSGHAELGKSYTPTKNYAGGLRAMTESSMSDGAKRSNSINQSTTKSKYRFNPER